MAAIQVRQSRALRPSSLSWITKDTAQRPRPSWWTNWQRRRCVQHERKTFGQGRKQMRSEKSGENEQAARYISAGKRWGLWLKETANFQSFLKTSRRQQHLRHLVMTHELDRFSWERRLM
jgi:hypothetical protein